MPASASAPSYGGGSAVGCGITGLSRACRSPQRSPTAWYPVSACCARCTLAGAGSDMTDRMRLAGLEFDLISQEQLVEQVTDAIRRGSGGTIIPPNVDICRRTRRDPDTRLLVHAPSIVVPDRMPLLSPP